MTQAKVGVLEIDCGNFPRLLRYANDIYDRFAPYEERLVVQPTLFQIRDARDSTLDLAQAFPKLPKPLRELLLLCYLDAVGYARRRKGKTPRDLFPDLLSRYFAAVRAFNETRRELGLALGHARVIEGDARQLQLPDESVDGILFSPPYSFAIDYVENDRPQLQYLGVDVESLKRSMVGLTGSGRTQKQLIESRVANYFADMETILRHCKRVLRPGRYCVIVVGSNTNQTGGVSLENGLIDIGARIGMPIEFQIMRQIEGIRNTMRDEFLLFFRKPESSNRDKVTRVQHLAELRDQRLRRGAPAFEVVACVDGRGFGIRREDVKKLLFATQGKLFTLQTVERIVDNTSLKNFQEL